MENKKYPHSDHRQRVRNAFRKADITVISDRALLEMILFYAIPRKDTNPIADRLLEKYGTLKNAADAPADELEKIDGIGESASLFLRILTEFSKRYCDESRKPETEVTTADYREIIGEFFRDKENEIFLMICFDALGNISSSDVISEGEADNAVISKRKILEAAFRSEADSVIIAHNHPAGDCAPSKEDIDATAEIKRLLDETEIRLIDHIIFAGGEILSLSSTVKFKKLFE